MQVCLRAHHVQCDSIPKFSQLLVSKLLYKKIQQRTTQSPHGRGYKEIPTLWQRSTLCSTECSTDSQLVVRAADNSLLELWTSEPHSCPLVSFSMLPALAERRPQVYVCSSVLVHGGSVCVEGRGGALPPHVSSDSRTTNSEIQTPGLKPVVLLFYNPFCPKYFGLKCQ